MTPPPDLNTLSRLFASKSLKAQIIGLTVFALFWIPDLAKIAGDQSLTFWQRVEQFSMATGKSMLSLIAIAIPPNAVLDKGDEDG